MRWPVRNSSWACSWYSTRLESSSRRSRCSSLCLPSSKMACCRCSIFESQFPPSTTSFSERTWPSVVSKRVRMVFCCSSCAARRAWTSWVSWNMRSTLSTRSSNRCSSMETSAESSLPKRPPRVGMLLARLALVASMRLVWSSERWLSSSSNFVQTRLSVSRVSSCRAFRSPASASRRCSREARRFCDSSMVVAITLMLDGTFWMWVSNSVCFCLNSSSNCLLHSQSLSSMRSTRRIWACISSDRPLKLPVSSASRRSNLGCMPSAVFIFSSNRAKAASLRRSPCC
mmetsp:Transcript_27793/g.79822  ORF Transcript_27793/g.79822 Transcript_27793/m.79822 type:complete len:286 (+) Transcript_27793:845-1702(+)